MLLDPYLPSMIMGAITVIFVAAFLFPATFDRKSKLLNFYWVGFWIFLALIAGIAGSAQTAILAGFNPTFLIDNLQPASVVCFVVFVMFGWVRLCGSALILGFKRLAHYRRAPAS